MTDFVITQLGDTLPAFSAVLTVDGEPITIPAGSTIVLTLTDAAGNTVTRTAEAGTQTGQVVYAWTPTDTASPVVWTPTVTITYPSGDVQTFPTAQTIYVGTAVVPPIVGVATYRRITGDNLTPDAEAEEALTDAINMVNDVCTRTFQFGTYTEVVRVYPNGYGYPRATPVQSATDPTSGVALDVQGDGVRCGQLDTATDFDAVYGGDWFGSRQPQATITYTGGYTALTLPAKVQRAICLCAYNIAHPNPLIGIPSGVNSASVGDVHLSAGNGRTLAAGDPMDSAVMANLNGYKRRQVRAF